MLHALSVFTAIFPGESRLAGFIGAKDDEGGGDNWSCKSCIAPVKSSPQTNQHPTFSASENVRTILHADADASKPLNDVKRWHLYPTQFTKCGLVYISGPLLSQYSSYTLTYRV